MARYATYLMVVRYANYLTLGIRENRRMIEVCANKITIISAANYPRLPNILRLVTLICIFMNINEHNGKEHTFLDLSIQAAGVAPIT